MDVVITGAAGFIGGHLARACLDQGARVLGIDCLTPYYDVSVKRATVAQLAEHPDFRFVKADLRTADVAPLLDGADVVYHLAGQPGVRLSWSAGFDEYASLNVLATQRVLEAAKRVRTPRLVYASSSSVYGNAPAYPTRETDLPRPFSPYGVTKLAGEHLCSLYAANYGLSTVSLRYFTVYGPRQRPDMGFSKFIDAALHQRAIPLYGDGSQVRDFTYVMDVVRATQAAGRADVPAGTVANVAGGGSCTVGEMLGMLGEIMGTPLLVEALPEQAGDVRATGGSIDEARRLLGWEPVVDLREGLTAQVRWTRRQLGLPDEPPGVGAPRTAEESAQAERVVGGDR